MEFADKAVLVTGSTTSIGFAIASAFLEAGARVMINGSDQGRLNAALRRLAGFGGRVGGHRADVRQAGEAAELVATVVGRFGGLDILVNCAGVSSSALVVDLTEAEWDWVLDTNLKGAFLVSQAAARVMLARDGGGRIVSIASTAGRSARPGAAHYCASKAGLILLTQTMALELGQHGITVNAVAPGLILADDKIRPPRPEYVAAFVKSVPLGYTGEPADIVRAVLFLASGQARYITGEVLTVDGGTLAGRLFLSLEDCQPG